MVSHTLLAVWRDKDCLKKYRNGFNSHLNIVFSSI